MITVRITGLRGESFGRIMALKTLLGTVIHTATLACNVKPYEKNNVMTTGLCSSRARWPLAPNFCPWATRKSQIFHTNHMLGTLDFTVSEHWAPFNFP